MMVEAGSRKTDKICDRLSDSTWLALFFEVFKDREEVRCWDVRWYLR